jgi:hypothetical protein
MATDTQPSSDQCCIKVQLANPITMSTMWEDRNIHSIAGAKTLEEAAYRAVRQTHDFLTDANHTFEASEKESTWGGEKFKFSSVVISPNDNSPPGAFANQRRGYVDYWFAVQYRAVP